MGESNEFPETNKKWPRRCGGLCGCHKNGPTPYNRNPALQATGGTTLRAWRPRQGDPTFGSIALPIGGCADRTLSITHIFCPPSRGPSERSSRWAEAVVEVLVGAGTFRASQGGLERSRRIPWPYQRGVLVQRRDSSTALRPLHLLRSAQNDTNPTWRAKFEGKDVGNAEDWAGALHRKRDTVVTRQSEHCHLPGCRSAR